MDVGGKNKRVKDNFKVFGVSNWTMEWIFFFFFFGEGLNCRKKWLRGGKCSVTPVYVKFEMPVSYLLPRWLSGKEPACNAGASGAASSIPGSGRSPGEGHDNPLQYSCLENPMDRGAWWGTVLRVLKNWTQLK